METNELKPDEILYRIARLSGEEYGLLNELVQADLLSKTQLDAWVTQIVDDRLTLAQNYLRHAQNCDLAQESDCRQAISRAYYVCHHAGRAVVYEVHRHDLETHDGVIKNIGRILGRQTGVKISRLHRLRNQVEYELYLPQIDLQRVAPTSMAQAEQFLYECQELIASRR